MSASTTRQLYESNLQLLFEHPIFYLRIISKMLESNKKNITFSLILSETLPTKYLQKIALTNCFSETSTPSTLHKCGLKTAHIFRTSYISLVQSSKNLSKKYSRVLSAPMIGTSRAIIY